MSDPIKTLVDRKLRGINKHKERLIAAYCAVYGVHPRFCVLVTEVRGDLTYYWVEPRIPHGTSETAAALIEKLRAQVNRLQARLSDVVEVALGAKEPD